jgi:hypothetical protein
MIPLFVVFILSIGLCARAEEKPVRLAGDAQAEEALRQFIEHNPKMTARLADVAKREQGLVAQNRDSDLHDAVSDATGPEDLTARLAKATAADRSGLLATMPGFKTLSPSTCHALIDCANPDLVADVGEPELLPSAVRELVRPWMLLQQARGAQLVLTPLVDTKDDGLLRLKLKGVDAAPLTLNVTPRPLGGFKVWFDQPLVLASVYGRERGIVLKTPR